MTSQFSYLKNPPCSTVFSNLVITKSLTSFPLGMTSFISTSISTCDSNLKIQIQKKVFFRSVQGIKWFPFENKLPPIIIFIIKHSFKTSLPSTLSLSLSLIYTHTHTHNISVSLSLFQKHARTNTHAFVSIKNQIASCQKNFGLKSLIQIHIYLITSARVVSKLTETLL